VLAGGGVRLGSGVVVAGIGGGLRSCFVIGKK